MKAPEIDDKLLKSMACGQQPFIFIATSDLEGVPNGASKLLLKCEGRYLYIVDYPVWKTYANLKINPRASLSLMYEDALEYYKIDGDVKIIEKGPVYNKLKKEMEDKLTDIAVTRIIDDVKEGKELKDPAIDVSGVYVFYKVRINRVRQLTFKKAPG